MGASQQPLLALRGVSKSFGATRALVDVALTLHPGEVHAVVGENGAGKSTLIKTITGIHRPDSGELLLDGEPMAFRSSREAQAAGVVAIYQEPLIFPDLTVTENIFAGHRNRRAWISWRSANREAAEILRSLDIDIDPTAQARTLSVAEQQAVEIAKAISLNTRVLIMDEPTASLSAHEADRLFSQVERLRERGVSVVFISHRLDEVFRISDRITVFRDGRTISSRPVAEYTRELLVREMVGRDLEQFFARTRHTPGDVLLDVRGLSRRGVFEDIDLTVRAGEVVGLAGLVGAGRTDVALALFGVAPAERGEIRIDGRPIRPRSPRQAMRHGIAYVSEDRRGVGLSLPLSVTANVTLPTLGRYRGAFGLLDRRAETVAAARYREQLHIRTASLETPVGNLSGGNQQKAMLAKWLNADPRLLILDEPTRGIDVGAKADVHQLIDDLAANGIGVLVISSDLPEVLELSDRIVVMREGRICGEFTHDAATQEAVMAKAIAA